MLFKNAKPRIIKKKSKMKLSIVKSVNCTFLRTSIFLLILNLI